MTLKLYTHVVTTPDGKLYSRGLTRTHLYALATKQPDGSWVVQEFNNSRAYSESTVRHIRRCDPTAQVVICATHNIDQRNQGEAA